MHIIAVERAREDEEIGNLKRNDLEAKVTSWRQEN